MSQIPSILVTDGWETDQNNILQEVVIPRTVNTLQAPNKVTFMGTTLNAIPSTAAVLQELDAPNCIQIPTDCCKQFTNLTYVNIPALTSLSSSNLLGGAFYGCTGLTSISFPALTSLSATLGGAFYGCTGLTSISLPALTSLISNLLGGAFYGCTGLTSISLPALTSLSSSSSNQNGCGAFWGCTSLESVSLPSLTSISSASNNGNPCGAFWGCTSLESVSLPSLVTNNDTVQQTATFCNCQNLTEVQLGSEGHAVTSLGAYMFKNCVQSNLTITVYTQGGTALSGEPWGATNATVVYEEA